MSKARTLNPYDMEERINRLEENGGVSADEAKRSDIATEFSATTSYTAGNFVYYQGKLYIFNVDHAAGAWDASDVSVANVTDEVTSNKAAIDAVDSTLTSLTKYSNLASGASVDVSGSTCLVAAKRTDSTTANEVNALALCVEGTLNYLVNSGGNTTPLLASYSNGVTTITNQNGVAVHFGAVVLN